MIVIARDTMTPASMPVLDEETKRKMAAAVVRAFIDFHPEIIADAVAEYRKEAGI